MAQHHDTNATRPDNTPAPTPDPGCTRLGCGRKVADDGSASCFCTDPAAMARLFPGDREAEVEECYDRERRERTPHYPLRHR